MGPPLWHRVFIRSIYWISCGRGKPINNIWIAVKPEHAPVARRVNYALAGNFRNQPYLCALGGPVGRRMSWKFPYPTGLIATAPIGGLKVLEITAAVCP
jgi:hypothetical protein